SSTSSSRTTGSSRSSSAARPDALRTPAPEPAVGGPRPSLRREEDVHVLHVGWVRGHAGVPARDEHRVEQPAVQPDVGERASVGIDPLDVELELDPAALEDGLGERRGLRTPALDGLPGGDGLGRVDPDQAAVDRAPGEDPRAGAGPWSEDGGAPQPTATARQRITSALRMGRASLVPPTPTRRA